MGYVAGMEDKSKCIQEFGGATFREEGICAEERSVKMYRNEVCLVSVAWNRLAWDRDWWQAEHMNEISGSRD